jgi:hypothetical protein
MLEERALLSTLLETFQRPTPAEGDQFGYSVAAIGENVLVGAPGVERDKFTVGAAYLFDSGRGKLLQTFPTPVGVEMLGMCVAALGEHVLVGDPSDNTCADLAGAVYLFDASTGYLMRTFLNPTPAEDDQFGLSLAVTASGNVLVGAPYDDTGAQDAGAAYLFDGLTGRLLRTFVNPTPVQNGQFGSSVATMGNHVLVSAPGNEVDGAIYLFDASSTTLTTTSGSASAIWPSSPRRSSRTSVIRGPNSPGRATSTTLGRSTSATWRSLPRTSSGRTAARSSIPAVSRRLGRVLGLFRRT